MKKFMTDTTPLHPKHSKAKLAMGSILVFLITSYQPVLSNDAQTPTANTQNQTAPTTTEQSLESLHTLVLNYLKQKADQNLVEPEFKIRELSKRLKLPSCSTPLEINDRNPNDHVGRMTIGVACASPKWQVYLPAEIHGKLPLIYSNRALLKGAKLLASDIRSELVTYNQIPPGTVIKAESIIGMRMKRSVPANSVIKVDYIQPEFWVFKNQPVNIITRIGEIEVKSSGVSQKNAVEGEQVEVENKFSKRTVQGIVIAPNTVFVP